MIILDAAFISAEAIFAKSSDRGGTKRSVETTSLPWFGSHSQSFFGLKHSLIYMSFRFTSEHFWSISDTFYARSDPV